MSSVALFEARNQLTALVRQVACGSPVEITRHGKPVAILMGIDDYKRLENSNNTFYSQLMDFRERYLDIDTPKDGDYGDPFTQVRASEPGRDLPW